MKHSNENGCYRIKNSFPSSFDFKDLQEYEDDPILSVTSNEDNNERTDSVPYSIQTWKYLAKYGSNRPIQCEETYLHAFSITNVKNNKRDQKKKKEELFCVIDRNREKNAKNQEGNKTFKP